MLRGCNTCVGCYCCGRDGAWADYLQEKSVWLALLAPGVFDRLDLSAELGEADETGPVDLFQVA